MLLLRLHRYSVFAVNPGCVCPEDTLTRRVQPPEVGLLAGSHLVSMNENRLTAAVGLRSWALCQYVVMEFLSTDPAYRTVRSVGVQSPVVAPVTPVGVGAVEPALTPRTHTV